MSTTWPMIQIGLGALIVAFGAFVTQRGWNEHGEVRERQAIVAGLAVSIEANQNLLKKAIAFADKFENPVVLSNPNYSPTETAVFSSAIASGALIDAEYRQLVAQIRLTFERLKTFNQSSARQLASPDQVKRNAERALQETQNLAALLTEYGYGPRRGD